MHVKDKVCVVTGAASGIGEAVARAYARAGARGVVVADLKSSRERLAGVAGDIDGFAVTADVGEEAVLVTLWIATRTAASKAPAKKNTASAKPQSSVLVARASK